MADTADFLKELIKNGIKPDGYEYSDSRDMRTPFCTSNQG
jgi:hypothetical protein